MDERALQLASGLVTAHHIDAGVEALRANARVWRSLLAQRRCGEEGLHEGAIEQLLHQLAQMDTNNFAAHVGAGEREGRVAVALVRRRCYGMTHGVGRSGDLTSSQPKAAGSSLLARVADVLALDVVRLAGATSTRAAVVVPMATGMTIALALRAVAAAREAQDMQAAAQAHVNVTSNNGDNNDDTKSSDDVCAREVAQRRARASYTPPRIVLCTRIDQKTALKCVEAAGLVPWPVELRPAPLQRARSRSRRNTTRTDDSDDKAGTEQQLHTQPPQQSLSCHPYYLQAHVDDVAAAMDAAGGAAAVLCVLSTTSCFAPRLPDDVVRTARLCAARGVAHVINNAYGLQSVPVMRAIDTAQRLGRVDYVVQSTDKNLLVPVGGAVLSGGDAAAVARAAALYAGRASAAPCVDVFVTALQLGRRGLRRLWRDRYACLRRLTRALHTFAQQRDEVLVSEDMHRYTLPRTRVTKKADKAQQQGEESSSSDEESSSHDDDDDTRTTALWPRNDISLAVTMRHWSADDARALGARLFRAAVTGPRVVVPAPHTRTTVAGCTFASYGTHTDAPPCAMLIVACGIGMTRRDVTLLLRRLSALWPAGAHAP